MFKTQDFDLFSKVLTQRTVFLKHYERHNVSKKRYQTTSMWRALRLRSHCHDEVNQIGFYRLNVTELIFSGLSGHANPSFSNRIRVAFIRGPKSGTYPIRGRVTWRRPLGSEPARCPADSCYFSRRALACRVHLMEFLDPGSALGLKATAYSLLLVAFSVKAAQNLQNTNGTAGQPRNVRRPPEQNARRTLATSMSILSRADTEGSCCWWRL